MRAIKYRYDESEHWVDAVLKKDMLLYDLAYRDAAFDRLYAAYERMLSQLRTEESTTVKINILRSFLNSTQDFITKYPESECWIKTEWIDWTTDAIEYLQQRQGSDA